MLSSRSRARASAFILLAVLPLALRAQQSGAPPRPLGVIEGVVADSNLTPVPKVTVIVLGSDRRAVTDSTGRFRLVGIPDGEYVLLARRLGFHALTTLVSAATADTTRLTLTMESFATTLGTVVITADDEVGFASRRRVGNGDFITAAEITKQNPARTTALLRGREGIWYTIDRSGSPTVLLSSAMRNCNPLVLIDGYRPMPPPPIAGRAGLDLTIAPEEIGGVEIYTSPSRVPREFLRWNFGPTSCGAIIFWTREALGLPPAPKAK